MAISELAIPLGSATTQQNQELRTDWDTEVSHSVPPFIGDRVPAVLPLSAVAG